jgi:hypothetical protein
MRSRRLVFIFSSVPLPIPIDALINEIAITDALKFARLLDQAEVREFWETAPLIPSFLHTTFPELWSSEKSADRWLERLLPGQHQKLQIGKVSDEPASLITYTISLTGSSQTLKSPLLEQALTRGWQIAQFRVGGKAGGEWSLFLYRGDRPSRCSLAAHLGVTPETLALRTLAGDPLTSAEDTGPATGDALLDQVLTLSAAGNVALPLSPEPLASLLGSPFRSAKQVKNWKSGAAVIQILAHGPPDGWRSVVYRLKARRGGKSAIAWIPPGLEPASAIASALGASPTDIILRTQEVNVTKSPWRKSHTAEESRSPAEWQEALALAAETEEPGAKGPGAHPASLTSLSRLIQ